MDLIRKGSIKQKLMRISMLTTCVALLLTSVLLIANEVIAFRQSLIERMGVMAKIIGTNSTAALTFNDKKTAEETLYALKSGKNITCAILYNRKGDVLAQYIRNVSAGDCRPHPVSPDEYHLGIDHLDTLQRIHLDNESIGTLYIQSDLKELYQLIQWYVVTVFMVIILSIAIAFGLMSRLQKIITKPLSDMADVMNTISGGNNYSVRVAIQSQDEVGILGEGFNEMLSQIQKRDTELELHREHLQDLVTQRTEDLARTNIDLQQELADRKKAEETVRKSEENYRLLFESAGQGILISKGETLQLVNAALTEILGYPREIITTRPFTSFIHPHDRAMVLDRHLRRLKGEAPETDYQFRIVASNGTEKWLHINSRIIPWDGGPASLSFITDVTERKQAEEELKYAHDRLRALAIRLQEVREETRTAISQDLHDDVGGKLAGLKMDLLRLEGIVSKVNDVEQRNVLMEVSHQAKELINNTILSARRIMMELRPSILDDFGLVAALEWQVEEFKTHTGISCQFVVEQQKVDMEKHTVTHIFRIFQEVLTNTARHSGATEVIARLSSDKEMLVLEVTDNGRGITEQQLSGRESLGLMGMKERALAIGGTIHVRGESGKGTSVALRVPMGREG